MRVVLIWFRIYVVRLLCVVCLLPNWLTWRSVVGFACLSVPVSLVVICFAGWFESEICPGCTPRGQYLTALVDFGLIMGAYLSRGGECRYQLYFAG